MNIVVLLGAPGSGKGTIAEKTKNRLEAEHLSTGDMLRTAVKDKTPVGQEAEAYMSRGDLVPDRIIVKLVEDRLDRGSPEAVYLLDGFPRTAEQAGMLEQSVAKRQGRIAVVIYLDAPREVLISRLTGRRICRQCGRNYHVVNLPPQEEGVCDDCGGALYQRPDDNRATIENRLDVYGQQTEELIDRYRKQGVLRQVDSSRDPDELAAQVAEIVCAS